MERKKLSDILHNSDRERLNKAWSETKAAQDLAPLPSGMYIARVIDGTATTAKTGTLGFKLTFRVLEGEFAGRLFWHDLWLTEAAMPMSKRDLLKLGVTSLDQLDNPLPQGIRCRVKLALRKDDNGNEHNRVRSFDVLGIDPPERDPFAPADDTEPVAAAQPTSNGEAKDELFPFGANAKAIGPYEEAR
jgi:hypothetical protein